MKYILKKILATILGFQVRRLRERNNFKIIGVVGSIGKTSTKLAIVQTLQSNKRVQYQEGNYNDIISVPLVFFGKKMPSPRNIFSWLKIIVQNEFQIYFTYPFDFVVLELGTDGPGQISEFRKYLHLDIAVVTAITPEHMEFFENIQNVAEEEWSVGYFSDIIFANRDLCPIIPDDVSRKKVILYGKDFGAVYKIENILRTKDGFSFDVSFEGKKIISVLYSAVSEIQLYSVCAAVVIANVSGISPEKIKESVNKIQSFSGRMQKLKGTKNSIIIDDTYNASPEAVKIALDALYAYPASQRIAILGMMNELGDSSEREHRRIGKYCDSKLLDLVVTIGKDASSFLAEEAENNGCRIYKAQNSIDAGKFVSEKLKENSVILAKGSQNGVFAEEALKPLLADKNDFSKLVRQDKVWMKKKRNL